MDCDGADRFGGCFGDGEQGSEGGRRDCEDCFSSLDMRKNKPHLEIACKVEGDH